MLTTVLNIRHWVGFSKQLLRGKGQLLLHLQRGTKVRTGSSTSPPCPQAWQTLRAASWGHTYSAPCLAVLLHRALPAQWGLGHTYSCPQLHQGLVKISWASAVHQDIGHIPREMAVRGTGISEESIPGSLPASCLSGRILLGRHRQHSSFHHCSQQHQLPKSSHTPHLSPFTGSAPQGS